MRLLSAMLLALIIIAGFAIPVYAIDDPDSPPQVNAAFVYENVLEDGDVGVLVDYYLDYVTPPPAHYPDETVTEAYLVVFIDTDGTTQLKSVAPYTFVDSGYGRGLAWIYFTAAEAATYVLDSADAALYRVWLVGNPTLAWAGDPPKTIATIDQWNTAADPATLVALRVLYYADILELAWTLDMVEATSIGNRLTTVGESYFVNVISNLHTIAPACFAAGEVQPAKEDIDYTTQFGAVITDEGLGTLSVALPLTLTEGVNNLIATGIGTFILEIAQGTTGVATSGDATVTGSPTALVAGTNTVTVTALGATGSFTIDVNLEDTTSGLEDSVIGTGFDLTTVAATFGMSRWMFSGIVWMIMSVIICAAIYRLSPDQYGGSSAGKILFPAFIICVVAGTLLGLLHPLVGIVMFIGIAGLFVGYILFFRGANA